jgi:hypothetical protein
MTTKPVATLVSITTVLLVALTALDGTKLLSERASAIVAASIAVINAILGVLVHNRVTPVAAPKTADGTALVPAQVSRAEESEKSRQNPE